MPRTVLNPQTPNIDGITPAFSAANVDGHSISNSGRTMVYVKNASAASINVTFVTPGLVDGMAIPDKVVAVPAGGERLIGRVRPEVYSRPSGGTDPNLTHVDFSAVASVTVAVLEP